MKKLRESAQKQKREDKAERRKLRRDAAGQEVPADGEELAPGGLEPDASSSDADRGGGALDAGG
jgi:hypothetical protein